MKPLVYFKLQAKNLFKDYKSRTIYVDEMDGQTHFAYKPKYFDIDQIFLDFDWPEEKFSLMKAQHFFALMLGFRKWADLLKATDEELELAKLLWDNQHKISLIDWQDYIASAEADNNAEFDVASRIAIFKRVFANVDGHHSLSVDYRLKSGDARAKKSKLFKETPRQSSEAKAMSPTAPQKFGEWILQQVGRDDLVGDLAKDAKRDPQFPHTKEIDDIVSYLRSHGVHVRSALAEAISDWRNLRRGGAAMEKVRAKSLTPEWTKSLKDEPIHAMIHRSSSGESVNTACHKGFHGGIERFSPLTESRSNVTCPECAKILDQNGWEFSQGGMCAGCDNFPHEGHVTSCVFVRVFGCSTVSSFPPDSNL